MERGHAEVWEGWRPPGVRKYVSHQLSQSPRCHLWLESVGVVRLVALPLLVPASLVSPPDVAAGPGVVPRGRSGRGCCCTACVLCHRKVSLRTQVPLPPGLQPPRRSCSTRWWQGELEQLTRTLLLARGKASALPPHFVSR